MCGKRHGQKWVEENDREELLGLLEENGPMGYNELFKKSDIGGKQTYVNRMEALEKDGFVERGYEKPEEGRGHQTWELTQKALDPVNKVIRRLNLTAGPNISLDKEKGQELLTEEVIETLLDIYVLAWYEPDSTWNLKIGERAEHVYEVSEITEYKLLKGLARYFLEAKTLDWKNQDTPRHINFLEPRFFRACVEHVKKGNEREKEFHSHVNLIKKISQKERDNPVLFPVVNRCRERNVEDKFEELLTWLKPLLCSQVELELGDVKEAVEKKYGSIPQVQQVQAPPEKTAQNKTSENEESVEPESSRGEKEERSLRDMYIDADNLTASVFREEARSYANDQLARAWRYYLNSEVTESEEKSEGGVRTRVRTQER